MTRDPEARPDTARPSRSLSPVRPRVSGTAQRESQPGFAPFTSLPGSAPPPPETHPREGGVCSRDVVSGASVGARR
jgi:hypothetical protein